ncbi:hypothetical protein L798_08842 [Zootermopsis nevadensis]|uniref:DUF6451 domain-containing protein n=1 Tax=Zootermopsis nevadensis TaxID=136037 RepID=A0A067REG4_ZOONE|nr:hypothetical protein L798_08842 [Zootermopsis nevadensis]
MQSVWKSNSFSPNIKLRIFNTNVKSVLLYGCETWKVTKELMQKLQSYINRCIRFLLKIRWPENISNEKLGRITHQTKIQQIKERKWKWLGHTLRKEDESISKQVLDWNPQGARKRGRPSITWRRSIEKEARSQGKSLKEIKALGNNRVRWRIFISALCSQEE